MSTVSSKIEEIKKDVIHKLDDELKSISGIKRMVFFSIFPRIFDLFSAECSEIEVSSALRSLELVNNEEVIANNYLSYDKAMNILGYGRNRMGFLALMRKHGIKNKTINNVHVGFPKKEILALKDKLREEVEAKKEKLRLKEQKRLEKKKRIYHDDEHPSWKSKII